MAECKGCNGTGKCTMCDGKGKVYGFFGDTPCERCKSNGKSNGKCTVCDGKGRT